MGKLTLVNLGNVDLGNVKRISVSVGIQWELTGSPRIPMSQSNYLTQKIECSNQSGKKNLRKTKLPREDTSREKK